MEQALAALDPQGCRLSSQQRNLWASDQEWSQHARNRCLFAVDGRLDAAVLRAGLDRLIDRHEILRTRLQRPRGMRYPLQFIGAGALLQWLDVDLSPLGRGARQAVDRVFAQLGAAATRREVSLEVALIRESATRHWLALSAPALTADLSSLRNVVREIQGLLAEGRGSDDASADIVQHADFAEWQHELLHADDEDAHRGRAYWAKISRHPVSLPYGKANSIDGRRAGGRVALSLTQELAQRLEDASTRAQVDTSAFSLACWVVVLSRLNAHEPVTVGRVCDGRGLDELAGAVGPYAMVLPLECAFDPALTFSEWLPQVGGWLEEGDEWQEYFDRESWSESGEGSELPIGFEYREAFAEVEGGGVRFSLLREESFVERFELMLECVAQAEGLEAVWHYDPARYERADVERIAGYYETLLSAALQSPDTPLGELALLPERERERQLVELNATQQAFVELPVHERFEAQARRTPQRAAVRCAEEVLSYGELNARANQLAHYLRSRGVGPGVNVGLCIDRSVWMVVGLLGVLKAGGAYVPLNPGYPAARLARQIEEIRAPLVLTQRAHVEALAPISEALLCVEEWEGLADQPLEDPKPLAGAQDAAYVIYTSGSTGQPKGVVIGHRSLSNYSHCIYERLGLAAEAGLEFATVSTLTADLGNTCIFPSLISGGCLHVLEYEVATDGEALARYVSEHPIDVLKIVPSHLSALLAGSAHPAGVLPRRYLILGGETLSFELLERIERAGAGCEVINHYGPTEATIGCLMGPARRTCSWALGSVPIGRPLANTQIYILDEQRKLLPLGVAGELYIGGAGLAQGYLNQPERTAERFVAHPFSDDPDARLYRTGDRVRYLPDGAVEFLGRTDHQVKIRGFRVELAEIESVVREHPGVREAVVVMREDAPGHKRLVAYVVGEVSGRELQHGVEAQLPEYMVPSAVVRLEKLPLTANGKIDRRALPSPEEAGLEDAQKFLAPRTETEQLLANIFAQVLGRERVGIDESFFSLGGHSLLAMKLVAKVREALSTDLPIKKLFEFPTVGAIAREIEVARANDAAPIPDIVAVPRVVDLPLSYAQERLWFLSRLIPDAAAYNVAAGTVFEGDLDLDVLRRALSEIVARHEILRTVYREHEGRPQQVILDDVPVLLPVVDLSALSDRERDEVARDLARAEAHEPFDLERGPLFRVKVIKLAAKQSLLLSTTHHIVSDVWSRGVLIRETALLYEAFAHRRRSPLSPLPVQYADFAVWQRQLMQGEHFERQLRYWTERLAQTHPLELLTDHPRPPLQSFRGASASTRVPESVARALGALSRKEGATLFMTMLAAFQTFLHRYTGDDVIDVGSPVMGRHRPETQGMIGFFLNTLVFRAELSGDVSFRDFLQQVRHDVLEGFEHQDLPFEKLVEALQPARSTSQSPLFQVAFVMVNAPSDKLELPGATLRPFKTETDTAKYDLTLFVVEDDGRLSLNVEYCIDLFERTTVERMLANFLALLASIVESPDRSVSALEVMSEPERARMLHDWNATSRDYELGCLDAAVAQEAQRHPDAIAVTYEGAHLTYSELEARARALAKRLRGLGVGPETRVGVCIERSLELAVGVLAVLQAGGAYVPLDPAYPLSRLKYMLEDSRTRVLLTKRRLVMELATQEGDVSLDSMIGEVDARVVYLDDPEVDEPTVRRGESGAVAAERNAETAAYVIYTSGSTGLPKGVVVSHRAVVNHMRWLIDEIALGSNDRVLQKTPLGFDAAGTELWAPLLSGGCVVMARPLGHQDSAYMVAAVAREQVTLLQLVPSLLRLLVAERGFGECRSLRHVLCAGEALPSALADAYANLGLTARLNNLYGPTEAAIDVTHWPCDAALDGAVVPIGRALANTELYVLDAYGQPVPVGVAGELHIGGVGLARGYDTKPQLTAERFVPNPYARGRGERLYRTGDRVRYREDGRLEFLGRIDSQVKLRGVRIELGEIEAVLAQHGELAEAVVVVDEGDHGPSRLVAYVVPAGQATPTVSELRQFLKQRLPDAMVPSVYVFLETLPLAPNGKLDRRALPAPEGARPELAAAYVAPRSEPEQRLVQIWSELLKLERVGIHDSFFELGGHSLLATQLIWRIREAFEIELPLRSVFETPTVAELASRLERSDDAEPDAPIEQIKAIPRERRRMRKDELRT